MSSEFDEYIRASRELNGAVERKELPIARVGEGFELSTVTFKKVGALVSLVASTERRIAPLSWRPEAVRAGEASIFLGS